MKRIILEELYYYITTHAHTGCYEGHSTFSTVQPFMKFGVLSILKNNEFKTLKTPITKK